MSQGSIELFNEDLDFIYPDQEQLIAWINQSFQSEKKQFESVNIIFCTDQYLLKLNQDYLLHDYFTDIISFQYSHEPIEGELYISLERVKENAENLQVPWMTELHRVIIHGVLHLIGYNDKSDEEISIMRKKEDFYLSKYPC